MAVVAIHNAWEGCGVLIEYRGSPDISVLFNVYVVTGAGETLVATQVIVSDVNGFAHWVWNGASAYPAGTNLRVDATGL